MKANDSKSYHLIPKRNSKNKEGSESPLWGIDHAGDDYGMRMLILEFELIGMPQTVKELFALFQSDDYIPIIWTDNDVFVYDSRYTVNAWLQQGPLFELRWEVENQNGRSQGLRFCSRAGLNTISCWDALFQLSMKGFSSSRLSSFRPIGRERELCPLSCEILEKFIVQSQKGRCGFLGLIFTPSQCRTLATTGKKTNLDFSNCRFLDHGLAFMDAYLLPENQDLGPSKLKIESHRSLFGDPVLIACLNKLQELTLSSLRNMSSGLLRRVVSADLDYLELSDVKHDDAGVVQILINNIREGRGPKGISLDYRFLGSQENLSNFCKALSYLNGRQYLKTLELIGGAFGRRLGPEAESAFLAAWSKNLGLTSFALREFDITETFWNSLLKQMPLQTSLRKLEFYWVRILDGTAVTNKERTEQLANVILANGHIEQMGFPVTLFDEESPDDEEVWQKLVVPALEHNKHRVRFSALETIGDGHERKAILAEALITVSDRPSLLYALLHRNLNAVGELVY